MSNNLTRHGSLSVGRCAKTIVVAILGTLMTGCGNSASDRPADDVRRVKSTTTPVVQRRGAVSPIDLRSIPQPETDVDRLARREDEAADDWQSEQYTAKINVLLDKLSSAIVTGDLTDDTLMEFMLSGVTLSVVGTDQYKVVFDDGMLVSQLGNDTRQQLTGFSGFRRWVTGWETSEGAMHRRVKFKLFRIDLGDNTLTTRNYLEIVTEAPNSTTQRNFECECLWEVVDAADIHLVQLSVIEAQASTIQIANRQLYQDCTRSVMSGTDAYTSQVVPGISHWLARIGREFMGQFGHHGIAVGDVNGDDLDDLYVCDAGGLPNRLYVQRLDGTVHDVSSSSGVDLMEDSLGALLIDLDNDGDQDLVVTTDPWLHFAENNGSGQFTLRFQFHAETDGYSLSAADFDRDGDLDVYLCGYNARRQDPASRGLPFPLPYHDANNGGQNYLLRNDGDFQFTDVTESVGLDQDNQRFSLAAAWEDYDNDGDLDLYVANDFGRNCLYQNDDGMFKNVAAAAGVEDHASGMSVSWGDFDRDGWMDLYVSNMFSAAGNRVTYQRRFAAGLEDEMVANVQRMARGNTLFRNQGDGTFSDESVAQDVTQGRWAWGSQFVDVNNDGRQDLVVANGYVTNEDTGDL